MTWSPICNCVVGMHRTAQQAELQPKAAEAQMLRDTVLVLNQELLRAAAERHALEAAREAARAAALQSLTEHGQVRCPLNVHAQHARSALQPCCIRG